MNGSYFRNVFVLILVNLVIKPLWIFGIEITVQNRVGSEVYGRYGALLFLSFIFQVILDLGLQTYNTQKIAQNPNRISHLMPNVLIAKLLLTLIYLGFIIGIAWYLGYDAHSLSLLFFLGVAQVFNSYALYIRSCITALQYFKADIFLSVLDRAVMIGICAYLLSATDISGFKIEWLVYAQVAAYLITALVSLRIVFRRTRWASFAIRLQHILPIIRNGLPFAVLILLMSLFMRGDLIILERLNIRLDPAQAGKYYEAYRLMDAANNFSGILLASWLLPLFAGRLKDKSYIRNLCSSAYRILLPVALSLVIFCYFFGEEIMKFFYKDYSAGDGFTLFLFMLAFPFYCLTYIYSTLNTAQNNIRQLILFAALAFVYNIGANLILAPKYGVTAVAVNCIITQAIFSLSNLTLAYKKFSMTLPYLSIGKLLLFALIVASACYALYRLDIDFIYALAVIGVLSIILVIATRIIAVSELKRFQNTGGPD